MYSLRELSFLGGSRLTLMGLNKALLPLPVTKVEGSLKRHWKQDPMLILKENVSQDCVSHVLGKKKLPSAEITHPSFNRA